MINEERVKELYQMALCDQKEEKAIQKNGEYYRSDYVSKELIKSFFTGTIAFGLLLLLWGLDRIETMKENIRMDDLLSNSVVIVLLYIAFMAVYLLVTAIVYYQRYGKERRKRKKYCGHLKKINKMYEREDKLKV